LQEKSYKKDEASLGNPKLAYLLYMPINDWLYGVGMTRKNTHIALAAMRVPIKRAHSLHGQIAIMAIAHTGFSHSPDLDWR